MSDQIELSEWKGLNQYLHLPIFIDPYYAIQSQQKEYQDIPVGIKKFPAENSGESDSVHLTDQLSNLGIIPDYMKVVDFIEEMEDYLNR